MGSFKGSHQLPEQPYFVPQGIDLDHPVGHISSGTHNQIKGRDGERGRGVFEVSYFECVSHL